MKTISHILLIWFCLLSMQPLTANISFSKKETCEKKCCKSSENNKKTADNCCKDGACNPLVSCSCCLYAAFKSDEIMIQKPYSLSTQITTIQPIFISGYCSSCFHPPQLI